MKHILPPLPYSYEALEPVISKETLTFHHDKHHKAYVDKLNELIVGTEFESLPLEEIMLKASGPIFNNAAQAWNHEFYWHSLTPKSGARDPKGALAEALKRDFGSIAQFQEAFGKAAVGQFGSGWAWLVRDGAAGAEGKLSIETTSNAENPLRKGKIPLLTVDVWEHAYYIDYRNARPKYLESVNQVINWEFAEARLGLQASAAGKLERQNVA